MTKKMFFDAGPLITLIMSRQIDLLPALKKKFNGEFYITPAVHLELVERPLSIRRFSLEALEVEKLIREGVLNVYELVPSGKVNELINLANHSFFINGKSLDILQSGEMESIVSALQEDSPIVMDERTLRLLIENPTEMKSLLEKRFQKNVYCDIEKAKAFSKSLQEVPIIRSIELIAVSYRLGLLNNYIPEGKDGQSVLLDSLFWAAKYGGCAVTQDEIEEMKKELLKK